MNKSQEQFMQLGIQEARHTMGKGYGGPFGAVIVKEGEVVSIASNTVIKDKDPTAHAEMNAIRKACKKLKTYDLTGCELYATGYPCPMCLSAIMWANIKTVYVSGIPQDAANIGFRDDFMYHFIESGKTDKNVLEIKNLNPAPAVELYTEYAKAQKTIY